MGCADMCSDSANLANSCSSDLGALCMTILSGSSAALLPLLAVEGAGVLVCVVQVSSLLTLSSPRTSSVVSSLM